MDSNRKEEAMTRNLKAFGLALVAAMALGAIGAQTASAVVEHSFRSPVENTVLTGSFDPSTGNHVFTATSGLIVECSAGTFSGTNVGKVLDRVTVHPKYSGCTSSLGNVTVDTDGCNYTFYSNTTEDAAHSPGTEHAAVGLECESSHAIEITAPGCNLAFSAAHSGTPVNQSLHGVRYTQLSSHSGKHAITVYATVKTIKYIATSGSLCGLAGHPAGTYSNGTYTGKASVTGYEDSAHSGGSTTTGTTWTHGNQVDITISTPT
jgi:hypothetical protein